MLDSTTPAATPATATAEEILDPTREVSVRGRTIAVRELNWRQLRQLLKAITTQMDRIMAIGANGQVALHMEQIVDVVLGDVSEALVSAATGVPVGDLAEMSARDYTALLEAAVSLNIHPEMVAAGKTLAARISSLRAA